MGAKAVFPANGHPLGRDERYGTRPEEDECVYRPADVEDDCRGETRTDEPVAWYLGHDGRVEGQSAAVIDRAGQIGNGAEPDGRRRHPAIAGCCEEKPSGYPRARRHGRDSRLRDHLPHPPWHVVQLGSEGA